MSLLLLHEQKQTLGEKKKYNAATLTEQSSHDIRNHKAEAHAKKERGERRISWTLVLDSGLEQLSPSLHARTGLERGWEKSLQNHLSAYCKSKQGQSICFGKLLLPFCKVCVAPACSRERKREGKGGGGDNKKKNQTPLLGGQRVSNPLSSGLEHRGKQVCSFTHCRESADASPLPLGSSRELGDDG